MEVGINPAGLRALLESETGPLGIEIQQRAAHVVAIARRNVAIIMDRSPVPVEQDVNYALRPGLEAVIGIKDTGRITHYLAEKETRERVWLVDALREVFD